MTELRKSLSFMDIYLFSIGYIIGAGIFILIGKIGKTAKGYSWISFLLAGIIAIIISSSYFDISHLYNTNFSEIKMVKKYFGEYTGILYIIITLGIGIFTNSTVSLTIGETLQPIINISPYMISILFIFIFSMINCIGIRESAIFNHCSTIVEIIALITIICYGFNRKKTIVSSTKSIGFTKIIYTSMLAMFAYSGFETTIKLTEESKNPNDIPIAILASIVSASIIYILIALVSVKIMSPKELLNSSFPLVDLSKILMGNNISKLFLLIGIFSISNTLLISILGTSRIVKSIGDMYPKIEWLGYIDKNTQTPIYATIIVSIASVLCLLVKDSEKLVKITTCLLFMLFAIVNACLIKAYYNNKTNAKLKTSWTNPINQGKPILPTISLLISLGILGFGCFQTMI